MVICTKWEKYMLRNYHGYLLTVLLLNDLQLWFYGELEVIAKNFSVKKETEVDRKSDSWKTTVLCLKRKLPAVFNFV